MILETKIVIFLYNYEYRKHMLKNKIEKHKPKFEEINDEKSFFGVFVSILGAITLGSMIMKD